MVRGNQIYGQNIIQLKCSFYFPTERHIGSKNPWSLIIVRDMLVFESVIFSGALAKKKKNFGDVNRRSIFSVWIVRRLFYIKPWSSSLLFYVHQVQNSRENSSSDGISELTYKFPTNHTDLMAEHHQVLIHWFQHIDKLMCMDVDWPCVCIIFWRFFFSS